MHLNLEKPMRTTGHVKADRSHTIIEIQNGHLNFEKAMRTTGHVMANRSHTIIEIQNEMFDDDPSALIARYIGDQRSSNQDCGRVDQEQ